MHQFNSNEDTLFDKLSDVALVKQEDLPVLTALFKQFPKIFYRMIRQFEAGSLTEPQFIIIPQQKGHLKFEKEKGKLKINYIKPKDKNFNEKFKTMLGEIYEELLSEEDIQNHKPRSLTDLLLDNQSSDI